MIQTMFVHIILRKLLVFTYGRNKCKLCSPLTSDLPSFSVSKSHHIVPRSGRDSLKSQVRVLVPLNDGGCLKEKGKGGREKYRRWVNRHYSVL